MFAFQAVCDSNQSGTPRGGSPPPRPRVTQRFPQEVNPSTFARNRVAKRQNDPSFSFLNNQGEEYSGAANNLRYKPKVSKKKNTNLRNFKSEPDSSKKGTSSNYGSGRNWQANGRGGNPGAPDRGETERESMPAQRRRGSATRVRHTLDHLVEDPVVDPAERPWSSSTFTLDKEEKSSNNRRVQQGEQGQ